jgi:7-cyano-7-deazaguanine synthase in queuosine biosynthesis
VEHEPAKPAYDQRLELRAFTQPANVRLQSLGERVYERLNPLAADLARIGAYVYCADRLVDRGGVDVYGDKWQRAFLFVIPVSDPAVWDRADVRVALEAALAFLTEDRYEFQFTAGGPFGEGDQSLFRDSRFAGADSVALFSGGLDSLSGVVYDHVLEDRRPILVSHRAAPPVDRRQKTLVGLLRQRFPKWAVMHVPAWVNLKESREREHSQRSRSFLYLALAAAVAHQLGKQRISIYENGVVSINIPISAQTIGARVTRTTHPKFLAEMQRFLGALLGVPFTIHTPLFWLTKTDVALRLKEVDQADLIQATTSCGHTFMMTAAEPHCGVCSQCLDRRVALEAGDLSAHDTPYVHDMFTADLDQVKDAAAARGMVLGYVRTHLGVDQMTVEQFVERYPEVYDVTDSVAGNPEETLSRIYALYQKQAAAVRSALLKADSRAAPTRLDGSLPRGCLLRMLYDGEHRKDPLSRLARRVSEIAGECLPRSFASKQPEQESQVRDALDGHLAVLREDVEKEFPIVAFSVAKQAKPDLSAAGGRLFIEVKYPRATRSIGQIGEEIAADITCYVDAGASVLFVVYDPEHRVTNRRRFVSDLEKHKGVFACVV